MRRMGIAVIAAAVAAFGCGGGSAPANQANNASGPAAAAQPAQPGQPADAAQSAQSMAQALQQMAQGAQQMQTGADGKPIQLIEFEKLIALLPVVPGWDQDKPRGEEQTQFLKMSDASAQYTKGDFHVKVTITDAALNPGMMSFMSMGMAMSNERTSTGFKRSTNYSGQPAVEEWNSESKEAKVTILVNKRFMVSAEGNGMDGFDVIKEVADKIDVGKIASLK